MNVEAPEGSVPIEQGAASPANVQDVHAPVNLGSDFEFTVKELALLVSEVVAELLAAEEGRSTNGGAEKSSAKMQPPELSYLPLPTHDPRQRRPDTTRAQALLSWNPRWGLREGLSEMARYYMARLREGSL